MVVIVDVALVDLFFKYRDLYYILDFADYVSRPVVPGCVGCAMAHPDFGRSVNPISTRRDRLCPHDYYWHTRIFRPSDGPEDVNFLES